MSRVIDISRRAARFNTDGLRGRIHSNALHHRQIDHEPVVTAAQARSVVAATTNGHQHVLVPREVNSGDDVGCVDAACDQARPLVDHAVVQGAHSVVVGIGRLNQSSAKILLKRCNRLFGHGRLRECRRSSTKGGLVVSKRRHLSPRPSYRRGSRADSPTTPWLCRASLDKSLRLPQLCTVLIPRRSGSVVGAPRVQVMNITPTILRKKIKDSPGLGESLVLKCRNRWSRGACKHRGVLATNVVRASRGAHGEPTD